MKGYAFNLPDVAAAKSGDWESKNGSLRLYMMSSSASTIQGEDVEPMDVASWRSFWKSTSLDVSANNASSLYFGLREWSSFFIDFEGGHFQLTKSIHCFDVCEVKNVFIPPLDFQYFEDLFDWISIFFGL